MITTDMIRENLERRGETGLDAESVRFVVAFYDQPWRRTMSPCHDADYTKLMEMAMDRGFDLGVEEFDAAVDLVFGDGGAYTWPHQSRASWLGIETAS